MRTVTLHYCACRWGSVDTAILLLEHGADARQTNRNTGKNVFHLLCSFEDLGKDTLEKLVSRLLAATNSTALDLMASDPEVLGQYRQPISHAVYRHWPNLLTVLLKNGATPDPWSFLLAASQHSIDCLEVLLNHAPLSAIYGIDFGGLLAAVIGSRLDAHIISPTRRVLCPKKDLAISRMDTVRFLKNTFLQLSYVSHELLHACAEADNSECINLVLSCCDTIMQANLVSTTLRIATQRGSTNIVHWCLNNNASLEVSENGLNSLHLCSIHTNNQEVCKAILCNDMAPDTPPSTNSDHLALELQTLLQFAIAGRNYEVADALIEANADHNAAVTCTGGISK